MGEQVWSPWSPPVPGAPAASAFLGSLSVSYDTDGWVSCLWRALIKCTNGAAFPNPTSVLLWNARTFPPWKMLHALTLNKPSEFRCTLGGKGHEFQAVIWESKEIKGFSWKEETKGIQKCHQKALQSLQLVPSCSLSDGLESVIYGTVPGVTDWLLKPATLKPVQPRFLSTCQIHGIKSKNNAHQLAQTVYISKLSTYQTCYFSLLLPCPFLLQFSP